MAITTPDAVPGEVIEAAWGDAVRSDLMNLDAGKANLAGATFTGDVYLSATQAGSAAAATRRDYVDGVATNLANTKVAKAGDTMTGNLVFGPGFGTAGNAGADVLTDGRFRSQVRLAAAANVACVRDGTSAVANGEPFASWLRGVGVVIGQVVIASGTSVAYNTTSDKRLKSVTRFVEPDEAVDKLAALEPVHYTWTAFPEDGEQVGFLAQDMYPVAPECVTPGRGEPGDDDFVPWGTDDGKLIPTLVAAIQALTRRIQILEQGATV